MYYYSRTVFVVWKVFFLWSLLIWKGFNFDFTGLFIRLLNRVCLMLIQGKVNRYAVGLCCVFLPTFFFWPLHLTMGTFLNIKDDQSENICMQELFLRGRYICCKIRVKSEISKLVATCLLCNSGLISQYVLMWHTVVWKYWNGLSVNMVWLSSPRQLKIAI